MGLGSLLSALPDCRSPMSAWPWRLGLAFGPVDATKFWQAGGPSKVGRGRAAGRYILEGGLLLWALGLRNFDEEVTP